MSGFFGVAVAFVPTGDYTLDSIRIPITVFTPNSQDRFNVELREGETEPGTVLERFSLAHSGFSVANMRSIRHPLLAVGRQYWVVVTADGSGEWGWGGLVHPPGQVFTLNTQYGSWRAMPSPSYVPGLQVSGTPAADSVVPIQFGNGGSIPHIVAGGGWQTSIVLVNTAAKPRSAQLSFWDDSGAPLLMPLFFPESDRSTTAPSIEETIPGGASITITASDTGPVRQGWAILTTSGDAGALAIIRSNPSGHETGLSIENRNANSYLLAFDNTGGVGTGIAVANLSALAVNVPVVMRDASGALLERAAVSLPARGHTSFDLAGKYALTKDTRGTIEFQTPEFGRISVIGLRFVPVSSGGGFSLTAIPVLAK